MVLNKLNVKARAIREFKTKDGRLLEGRIDEILKGRMKEKADTACTQEN